MRRERIVAAALIIAAVLAVPVWLMIDGIRDPFRDSSWQAYAVAYSIIGLVLLGCFFAALVFALRQSRPIASAVAVTGAIGIAHLAAWVAGERLEIWWGALGVYLAVGVLTAAALASWAPRESEADDVGVTQ